ncbi:MAG: hypothetical protein ACI9XK_003093 [Granulosicoccus sp.]|jgi:hypothetical protein
MYELNIDKSVNRKHSVTRLFFFTKKPMSVSSTYQDKGSRSAALKLGHHLKHVSFYQFSYWSSYD